jgi:hypothetical protein
MTRRVIATIPWVRISLTLRQPTTSAAAPNSFRNGSPAGATPDLIKAARTSSTLVSRLEAAEKDLVGPFDPHLPSQGGKGCTLSPIERFAQHGHSPCGSDPEAPIRLRRSTFSP